MIKIIKKKQGYAILELLFYVVFFSILSLVVINAMITMARVFRETAVYGELGQNGVIVERIVREIRQSYDINSISASDLVLNSTDAVGANKTVRFLLSGTNLQFFENAIFIGNLNTPNIIVTGLTFTQITTVKSKAVKVALSFRSSNDKLNRVQNFYDTIVLRGGY